MNLLATALNTQTRDTLRGLAYACGVQRGRNKKDTIANLVEGIRDGRVKANFAFACRVAIVAPIIIPVKSTPQPENSNMEKTRYWRFKSNMQTVVEDIGSKLVRIVWSDTSRLWSTWCIYRRIEENLVPLTEEQAKAVDELIAADLPGFRQSKSLAPYA